MGLRTLGTALLATGTLVGSSLIGATVSSAAARTAPPKPQLECPYYLVCGQAANGSSFAYRDCNFEFKLPNLIGSGPLVNNQTAGTVARFYDKNHRLLFTSTTYEARTVNWTPVWYARAC
ncbi:hypothetical protein [Streptomyces huiliensis]|uniref:hypothetical protein n=1 Tax=Streptomyces huiliensis TaxID=2876027 RepID=UPI001CBADEAF|nr:hypothetical protein [Streptomyces huiliensis]MBZ4319966.1 hypothetical protein [Streptomyces huiliensis]